MALSAKEARQLLLASALALGLLVCFVLYGVFQERIMTTSFVYNGVEEKFEYSAFIVFVNRITTILSALAVICFRGGSIGYQLEPWKYAIIALSNTVATFCQYEALKYLSFPSSTLGKCAKTIPVLVWGSLIGGKEYAPVDYIVAIVLTAGCSLFALTGDISAPDSTDTSGYGIFLICFYLSVDGFTSVFQERLFKAYKVSPYNQLLHVSLFSGTFVTISLVSSGQMLSAVSFCARHPSLLWDAIALSFCSMAGQMCIYNSIQIFGAMFFATVMTTRQVLSIVLSCILFFHPLSWMQLVASVVVFGTLYAKTIIAGQKKKPILPVGAGSGSSGTGSLSARQLRSI
eukprot:TRINITY_DN8279_c0_g1_i1.p1 TRINITY_DN8279_c0_g1~~TRINITY_DN8279_c0_g1_i1.p1  ORF type:complete len:345 (-),score=86.27 TRINITY_DN8279_c0_g1_i1:8-1042(-)